MLKMESNQLKKVYGSLQEFKKSYGSSMMDKTAKDKQRTYNGISPTLADVSAAFGDGSSEAWTKTILDWSVEFIGKGGLTLMQKDTIAKMICVRDNLKVTEVLLFFWRLCNAEYGKPFGAISPLFIMEGFNKFVGQRERERVAYTINTTDDIEDADREPPMAPNEFRRLVEKGLTGLSSADREWALKILSRCDVDGVDDE